MTSDPDRAREIATERRSHAVGLGYGAAAHLFWGLVPLYWKLLRTVEPGEVVAHRIIWALSTFLVIVVARSRLGELRRALRDRRALRAMLASGTLVAINWLTFIYAVETNRVLHASLGYFINPIVAAILGRVVLKEHLRPIELIAFAIATVGVVQYTVLAGTLPWISLVVAFSFGLYSLVRKTAPVDGLIGSTLESLLLAPFFAGYLVYRFKSGDAVFGNGGTSFWLLLLSGPVTAFPSLWFINAARRLPLWTMGFLQYLTPTTQFLLAILVWHEPLTVLHFTSFGCIWCGLIVFSASLWIRFRKRRS